jgi:hypothetical protein
MRRTFVLMAVAAIALVGCGGGGGAKSSSTTAASGSSATTAKPASSNAAASSGGKFCADAATRNLAQQLQSSASAGTGTDALQRNLDLLKTYEREAPSAIKADVTTLVTFYTKFVQIMTNDKSDQSKLVTDMQGIEGDQAALQAASQHIGAYYAANCHA